VFTVQAINADGLLAPSSPTTGVAVYSATPPGAPTGLSASASSFSNDPVVDLGWTAPISVGGSPLTGYTITPSSGSPISVPAGTTSDDYRGAGAPGGTSPSFPTTANTPGGSSPAASFGTVYVPSSPPAPTNVTATAGDGSATVSWDSDDEGSSWFYVV